MKSIDGVPVKGWLYRDDLRIVAELDGTGAVTSRFVWADGTGAEETAVETILTRMGISVPDLIGDLLHASGSSAAMASPAYMVRDGNVYRILADDLGTPRLVVDVATGTVQKRLDCNEWGIVVQDTNPELIPFGFAGGLYDADTGLVRFGARDYEPAQGRWTTGDPTIFLESTNRYEYGQGDPINQADRIGLGLACSACKGVCIAIASGCFASVPGALDSIVSPEGGFCAAVLAACREGCNRSPLCRPPRPRRRAPQHCPKSPEEGDDDIGGGWSR